jgi:AcrR family transcriptional regulator
VRALSEQPEKPDEEARPARAPGARGLTRLHAAQRVAYRERIIGAAAEVFVERSYVATTVDDVLARAGVSRPTFYRYFDNKFDLAVSLLRSTTPESLAPYKAFVAAGDRGERAVRAMISEVMGFYDRHASLVRVMTEITAIDPQYMREIDTAFDQTARELSRLLPAFQKTSRAAKAQATRARLVLHQIAITCQTTVTGEGRLDRAAAIDLLTEQFVAFCSAR